MEPFRKLFKLSKYLVIYIQERTQIQPRSLYKMPDGYKQAYDPLVFKHRGKHYLIISESKSLYLPFYAFVFALTESMDKIVSGSKVELPPMEGFHEKPFLFERNGKVYMISGGYASLRYWMADDLFGPYKYIGDFFTGTDTFTISKTTHGSV